MPSVFHPPTLRPPAGCRYGATNVSDNLLQNEWLPGVGTFVLNLAVTSEPHLAGWRGQWQRECGAVTGDTNAAADGGRTGSLMGPDAA